MKNIVKRLKSETPSFFKRVREICLGIAAVSTMGYQMTDKLPPFVVENLDIGMAIGLVGAFIAQLTKKDSANNSDNGKA